MAWKLKNGREIWCERCFHEHDTGICYCSDNEYDKKVKCDRKKRENLDADTQQLRKYAARFGGKALTGTSKQKKWAEKIRYKILRQVSEKHAAELCKNDILQSSKAWINFEVNKKELMELVRSLNNIYSLRKKYYDNYEDGDFKKSCESQYEKEYDYFSSLFSEIG